MAKVNNTQFFKVNKEPENQVQEVLVNVLRALDEKGYNSVNQIVGYILSGDPTYITSYGNARSNIMKIERDELLEELIKVYINVICRSNQVEQQQRVQQQRDQQQKAQQQIYKDGYRQDY